jgi:hypothetical protein
MSQADGGHISQRPGDAQIRRGQTDLAWWKVARTCGMSIAGAAPWTIRAAISA